MDEAVWIETPAIEIGADEERMKIRCTIPEFGPMRIIWSDNTPFDQSWWTPSDATPISGER